ncbi:MAG: hypothetical protein ABI699_09140 [Caldimonas sp.]
MKAATLASEGEGAPRAPGTPLVVGSRSRPIVWVALGSLATAAFMVLVRRDELEFDDWLMSAGVLVLALWLFAQAGGLLVRRAAAGHALRLDAAGLHHPGWGVVPWPAVRSVTFRRLGGSGVRSLLHLVVDIDPGCPGPAQGGYVRWLFGPVEGLFRRHRPLEIPLIAIDAEPMALVAAVELWRAGAGRSKP